MGHCGKVGTWACVGECGEVEVMSMTDGGRKMVPLREDESVIGCSIV